MEKELGSTVYSPQFTGHKSQAVVRGGGGAVRTRDAEISQIIDHDVFSNCPWGFSKKIYGL